MESEEQAAEFELTSDGCGRLGFLLRSTPTRESVGMLPRGDPQQASRLTEGGHIAGVDGVEAPEFITALPLLHTEPVPMGRASTVDG